MAAPAAVAVMVTEVIAAVPAVVTAAMVRVISITAPAAKVKTLPQERLENLQIRYMQAVVAETVLTEAQAVAVMVLITGKAPLLLKVRPIQEAVAAVAHITAEQPVPQAAVE